MELKPQKLPQALTKTDKTILFVLFLIIFSCLVYLKFKGVYQTREIPISGGTYTEGILGASTNSLSEITTYLTNAGLTRLGADGSIQPSLAKSWQISEDGKIYTFNLQKGVDSGKLIESVKLQKGSWSELNFSAVNPETLKIELKQPYGQFLASTMQPLFPYGSYKINAKNSAQVSFIPNPQSPIKPYFNKVIIKIFATQHELYAALNSNQIIATSEELPRYPREYRKYSLNLPRYQMAFLNISKAPFNDKTIREKLIKNQKLPKPLTVTLLRPDTPKAKQFFIELRKIWQKQNIIVNEQVYDPATLLSIEAPKKQYDIIIYGLNLGYYQDLYPCWHSSQIVPSGLNFSQINILALDKLLQEARLTLDDKTRKAKFSEAQTIINNEYLAISEPSVSENFYIHKGIKGVSVNYAATPMDRYTFIDKWYINTKRIKN